MALCNTSNLLKFTLFADDMNSFYTGSNLKPICQVITSELEKLNLWFSLNKLSFNVTKLIIWFLERQISTRVKLSTLIVMPLKECIQKVFGSAS